MWSEIIKGKSVTLFSNSAKIFASKENSKMRPLKGSRLFTSFLLTILFSFPKNIKEANAHKHLASDYFVAKISISLCFVPLQPTDEDDSVKSGNIRSSKLGSRLSVRNGRSVVHKNLEDNYGAVISANHEALAQILEQVRIRKQAWKIFSRPITSCDQEEIF